MEDTVVGKVNKSSCIHNRLHRPHLHTIALIQAPTQQNFIQLQPNNQEAEYKSPFINYRNKLLVKCTKFYHLLSSRITI